MAKFILCYNTPEVFVAGYKYENDLTQIFVEEGFIAVRYGVKVNNKLTRQLDRVYIFFKWFIKFKKDDTIFYLGPMNKWYKKILDFISKIKGVKTYAVVTDIDYLRGLNKRALEMKLYMHDSGAILQNQVMADAFIKYGFKGIVSTQKCLDFLIAVDKYKMDVRNKVLHEKIMICFGGNLDKRKAAFVYSLSKINWKKVQFNLYGINIQEKIDSEYVSYYGFCEPNELIDLLQGDFGLVWDGDSLDGCCGPSGDYYKYACPHKFSQYIACGMPVIVWRKSVMSDFVLANQCGICIDNLLELDKIMERITVSDYNTLLHGAWELRDKIISGYFTRTAIKNLYE